MHSVAVAHAAPRDCFGLHSEPSHHALIVQSDAPVHDAPHPELVHA